MALVRSNTFCNLILEVDGVEYVIIRQKPAKRDTESQYHAMMQDVLITEDPVAQKAAEIAARKAKREARIAARKKSASDAAKRLADSKERMAKAIIYVEGEFGAPQVAADSAEEFDMAAQ